MNNEPTAIFLRACRGLPTERTPIWLMRQAGRYMADYRAIREKYSMLEVIRTPELAAEVTLQPINKFGFDAAIIFSDILPALIGMGLKLDFIKGEGPAIENPITRSYDVDVLATPPAEENMAGTLAAIKLVSQELAPRNIPLIGFAGAPFTLASYAIEGGSTSHFYKVKAFMYAEPAAWKRLMTKLVTVQSDYLLKQVKAGASALQVFDSWAGQALSQQDYQEYVQPYNRQLFQAIANAGVPVINFSLGVGSYLADAASCGGDVIGLDWRMPLDWSWRQLGYDKPVQGNLDPVALLAPWRELRHRTDRVLASACVDPNEPSTRRPGHIFNLGHGILPNTSIDNVQRLVDHVRAQTTSQSAS